MNINNQLLKFAEADLKLARQKGSISICNTRRGLVEIRYDRDWAPRPYSVLANWKPQLTFVTKSEALAFIVSAYDVVGG